MISIKKIKKVELHLHLDGSLRVETVHELLKKEGKEFSIEKLEDMLKIKDENKDLLEYLKRFDLPLEIMQSKENLERVAYELVEDLSKENYIYAEIRFAPHLHMKKGLNLNEITEAVLRGMERAYKDFSLKTGLLLCVMRHMSKVKSYEILDLAKKYKDSGVLGMDLAGDEKNFPVKDFEDVFVEAKSFGINYTIHAGEAEGAFSVRDAVRLGAKRIGHGVRAFEDVELLKEIIEKKILLEMCPKSNIQTAVLENFKDYPISKYIKMGVAVSLNSDNRTVSNTNICNEAMILMKEFKIKPEEIIVMMKNALKGSFLNKEEKLKLLEELT